MSAQPRQLAHTVVTVGVASALLVAANLDRTYLLIINDSDAAVYLKFGATAVVSEGIRLNANGGSLEISEVNGNLDNRVVNAIAGAAAKIVLIAEA